MKQGRCSNSWSRTTSSSVAARTFSSERFSSPVSTPARTRRSSRASLESLAHQRPRVTADGGQVGSVDGALRIGEGLLQAAGRVAEFDDQAIGVGAQLSEIDLIDVRCDAIRRLNQLIGAIQQARQVQVLRRDSSLSPTTT